MEGLRGYYTSSVICRRGLRATVAENSVSLAHAHRAYSDQAAFRPSRRIAECDTPQRLGIPQREKQRRSRCISRPSSAERGNVCCVSYAEAMRSAAELRVGAGAPRAAGPVRRLLRELPDAPWWARQRLAALAAAL